MATILILEPDQTVSVLIGAVVELVGAEPIYGDAPGGAAPRILRTMIDHTATGRKSSRGRSGLTDARAAATDPLTSVWRLVKTFPGRQRVGEG